MKRVWLLAFTALLTTTSTARAFCRSTTAKPTREELESGACVKRGVPTFWRERTLSYSFQSELGSSDMSAARVQDVFRRAFAAWHRTECDGEPFVVTASVSDATEKTASHVLGRDNVNAIMFQTARRWEELDYDPVAFALTTSWYEPDTGEIFGSDMELNEGRGPYTECPDEGCDATARLTDLANVVTHEAGHFLGLSHSGDFDATMFYRAEPGQVDKRELGADDLRGLCEIQEEDHAIEPTTLAPGPDPGCSVAPHAHCEPGWLMLVAFSLAARFGARRRSRDSLRLRTPPAP